MAVFKFEYCPSCNYKRKEPNPVRNPQNSCPKCQTIMRYSKNWSISYQVAGKKKVKSIGPQKRMAEAALGKIKTEIQENKHFDKDPSTSWNKAVEMFRQWIETGVKTGSLAVKTQKMYLNSLSHLSPHFDELTLDKITPAMVEAYRVKRASYVSSATVNRDLSTIKRLFSLSEEWGLVGPNQIRNIKRFKEGNGRNRFLTKEEQERLLSECKSTHLHLVVLIALNTGLRKNNILTLKWTDINFKEGFVKKIGKGNKEVKIPLTHKLKQALKEHMTNEKVLSPYVIQSPIKPGHPLNDVKNGYRAACRRAEIKDF